MKDDTTKPNFDYSTAIRSAPLVKGGPEIPEELFKSHQEGKLVIFCGSGISRKLGLGDFEELMKYIKKEFKLPKSVNAKENPDDNQPPKSNDDIIYDLSLLEQESSRHFYKKISEWGDLNNKEELDFSTHQALVKLSQFFIGGKQMTRLVTTNFDNAFEVMDYGDIDKPKIHIAPELPNIKNDGWNGIVQLHGSIKKPEEIVLTVAGFGEAYITDGWARRFLIDLFNIYDVLFIGYSAKDPIIRQLMHALSSEEKSAFRGRKRFAFTSGSDVKHWELLNTKAIEYFGEDKYSKLHSTLITWSNIHIGGVTKFQENSSSYAGKSPNIDDPLVKYILTQLFTNPHKTTRSFISSLFKKEDADIRYPIFAWWSCLSDQERVRGNPEGKNKSLVNLFVVNKNIASEECFDKLEEYHYTYMNWFIAMMNDDDLKKWVVDQGSILHPILHKNILNSYERNIRDKLSKSSRIFWEYLIFNRDYLKSRSTLRQHYKNYKELDIQKITELVKIDVNISENYYHRDELDFNQNIQIEYILRKRRAPNALPLISQYIENCQDETSIRRIYYLIYAELNKVIESESHWGNMNDSYDTISIGIKSIRRHSQNYSRIIFPGIIYNLTSCIKKLSNLNPNMARNMIALLFDSEIIIERRLALHFLINKSLFDIEQVWEYLYSKNNQGLIWQDLYKREWYRLIHARWAELNSKQQQYIIDEILKGPPSDKYRTKLSASKNKMYLMADKVDKLRWFKYQDIQLSNDIKNKIEKSLAATIKHYPDYGFDESNTLALEQLEFSGWVYPARSRSTIVEVADLYGIKDSDELISAIVERENSHEFGDMQSLNYDSWMDSAGSDILLTAMMKLANNPTQYPQKGNSSIIGKFFAGVSRTNKEALIQHQEDLISMLRATPDHLLETEHNFASQLLVAIIAKGETKLADVKDIWDKLFNFASQDRKEYYSDDYVMASLNTSIGILCDILFTDHLKSVKKQNDGLSKHIEWLWDEMLNSKDISVYQKSVIYSVYGRFTYTISILDMNWFKANLLPALQKLDGYSLIMWNRYMYHPAVNDNLLYLLKAELIKISEMLDHIDSRCIENYTNVILYASIYPADKMSPDNFRIILSRLNSRDRGGVLKQVSGILVDEDTKKGQEIWESKIRPWIDEYWPLTDNYLLPSYNKHWLSLIMDVPQPTKEDIEFISSLLSPVTLKNADDNYEVSELRLDRLETRDKLPTNKKYMLLFAALLKESADGYYHHDIESIVNATKKIKQKFGKQFTKEDETNYDLIKSIIKNSSKHAHLWSSD